MEYHVIEVLVPRDGDAETNEQILEKCRNDGGFAAVDGIPTSFGLRIGYLPHFTSNSEAR